MLSKNTALVGFLKNVDNTFVYNLQPNFYENLQSTHFKQANLQLQFTRMFENLNLHIKTTKLLG